MSPPSIIPRKGIWWAMCAPNKKRLHRRLFRSFFVIEPFNRRKWFVIHPSPISGQPRQPDNTFVACMSHSVCFRLHSKKLDFILRFDFVFFLLGFAFLLRTSAIQVNLMALGLSSVAWHRLSNLISAHASFVSSSFVWIRHGSYG